MDLAMSAILSRFALEGTPLSCTPFGAGHVNKTYLVTTDRSRRYILQRINHLAFPRVDELMENITRVTAHLRKKVSDPREVMGLVPTADGGSYCCIGGEYWRVLHFTEGTICLDRPETPQDFYESAVGFGRFQQLLSDFPVEQLHDTIERFHDTPDRYRLFKEAIRKDPLGRAASVQREIDFALEREEELSRLQHLRDRGELPLRVTHNDTKLNNVLLDAKTRKALCVIDLDTVMAGLSLYDFGDAIRFGAATAAEDERDLSLVTMDPAMYRIFTRGFVSECTALTREERELLPMGARVMTTECGVRFLTDYLMGDVYFSIHREGQNLDRARTQFKMELDMEQKWDEMRKITKEEAGA